MGMHTKWITQIKNRQIELPQELLKKEGFREGDPFQIIDIGGTITLYRVTEKSAIDMLKELGSELKARGYTKRKVIHLIDEIKDEIANERLKNAS